MTVTQGEHSHTCQWEDPYVLAAALSERSPIDGLHAMLTGQLPPAPIEQLLGFRGVSVKPGEIVIEGQPSERLLNHHGVINGGWHLTLIYAAAATAIESTLERGYAIVVVEQSAQLIRHALAGSGPVLATGTVSHRGRTLATGHADVRDATSEKLLAEGTVTAIVQTIDALLGRRPPLAT